MKKSLIRRLRTWMKMKTKAAKILIIIMMK